ncbi:MAG: Do family serine endopeptidase [Acidobacteriaceae bacterium]|nr:Do family serine endopeptidase [Acidobacteriaceae bacterium]MBV9780850.1 Do family serine endopeptidase [Acidobacteriaceae bacterium]
MSQVIQFRRTTAILTLIAASIGGGLVAALAVATHSKAPVYVTARAADTKDANTQRVTQLSNSFADIIEKASPAVVKISMTRIIKASDQQQNNPFMSDPFFRQFFGGPMARPRDQREQGLGSGVIVSGSGYILTNNHVVEKANSLKVSLSDGRDFTGKVVGADPQTDVAVVKINASNLPTLQFANSDGARVGDLCFAIGNPFGQDHTVTMGIVSAKGRKLEGGTYIQNFIQTDAAINPGNSGGALINARGELIGMNTMILTGNSGFGGEGGNIGIGFAVPSNMAKQVMDQIMKTGKVSRGYMGVSLQPVTPELAQQFGLKTGERGAIVADVTPGAPGSKAGLKSGDVITAIDGKKVEGSDDLTMEVISHSPGNTVTLDVIRNGEPMKVSVTLGQRPGSVDLRDWNKRNGQGENNNEEEDNGNTGNASARGISVETLTGDLAQQLNVPANTRGVVVDEVDESSPAADAGIGRGIVITAVDRKPVSNAQDFKRLMSQAQNKPVLLTVNQGGQTGFVVVQPK